MTDYADLIARLEADATYVAVISPLPKEQTLQWEAARALRELTAAVNEEVAAETSRCVAIVQQARFGEIDGDFRTIIHFIENPLPAPPKGE